MCDRTFAANNDVYIRNFGPGEVWLPGIITQVSGPGSYTVELSDGRCVRRHQDHLHQCCDTQPISSSNSQPSESDLADPAARPVRDSLPATTPKPDQIACPSPREHNTPPPSPSPLQQRYPTCVRQPPDRLTLSHS